MRTKDAAKLIGITTTRLLRLRSEGRVYYSVLSNGYYCFHRNDLLDLEVDLLVEKERKAEAKTVARTKEETRSVVEEATAWKIESWSEYKKERKFQLNEENGSGGCSEPNPTGWGKTKEERLEREEEFRLAIEARERRRKLVEKVRSRERFLSSVRRAVSKNGEVTLGQPPVLANTTQQDSHELQ